MFHLGHTPSPAYLRGIETEDVGIGEYVYGMSPAYLRGIETTVFKPGGRTVK